jgi:RHS repeat-associated protein
VSAARLLAAALALAAAFAPSAATAQASAAPYMSAQRYDSGNRVTGTIAPDPDDAGPLPFPAVRNTYDAAGRLIKVETGALAAWQADGIAPSAWTGFTVHRSVETVYDAMSRKVREILREGAAGTIRTATDYSYDLAGRADCTAVRMNSANFAAPLAACTQGSGGADRITRNIYDAAGQRVQVREGVGTAIEAAEATWRYTPNGQIDVVIDANGNRAELRYDVYGRQDRWTFPSIVGPATPGQPAYNDATQATALATSGSVNAADYEEYGYDPQGNRVSLRKRDDSTLAYSYDALNRVMLKTATPASARTSTPQELTSAQHRPVYYAYDLRNLQTQARFDSLSGEAIVNSYDGFGRLVSSANSMGGTTRTLSYQYDRDGNRTRITHPDSVYFTSAYDGLDRPVGLADQTTTRVIMGYNVYGSPVGVIRNNRTFTNFGYDGVQRLNAAGMGYDFPGYIEENLILLERNPAGQISSITNNNNAYAWTGHHAVLRAYTTNGLNQYDAAGVATLTYDANGNLVTETVPVGGTPQTTTYVYDVENRLVSRSGGVSLVYDPLGRLFSVASPGAATQFLYDGSALVGEYVSGTMTKRYVHNVGADVPMMTYSGTGLTTLTYLHPNHQGSIVAVSDGSGAHTTNTYDEYGIPSAANTGRFQYTGQIWLNELGLYHYKARIYSPTLGRFLQVDPVGYRGGVNLYGYVGNDPLNYTDHTGLGRVCVQVQDPGSLLSSQRCVDVDGNRDGNTRDNDLNSSELARIRRSFGGFIRQWGASPNGAVPNLTRYGKPIVGNTDSEGMNRISITSQFVGYAASNMRGIANGAWSRIRAIEAGRAGSGYGLGPSANGHNGYIGYSGDPLVEGSANSIYNSSYSDLARLMFHEFDHEFLSLNNISHQDLDAVARYQLRAFGMDGEGCAASWGFPGC